MTTRFRALVPYTYSTPEGEKTGWTEVGSAFALKGRPGHLVEIRPGLSISGRLVLVPASQSREAHPEGSPHEPGSFHYDPSDLRDLV